jgi:Flp pilus assembly protein TadG
MTSKVTTLAQRFASEERGTVAVLFGLMFMVLVLMTGVAVDHSRLIHSQSKIAAAADAAALAAGRGLLDGRMTDDEIKDMALKYFNENLGAGGKFGDINQVRIAVNRQTGTVTVDVDAELPLTITRVAGFETFDVPVKSATIFDQKDIELGMALDVTGSMAGQKITDLKLAAKDLVDILLPDGGTQNKIRIGLAPYAAGVNAGAYAAAVTNNVSTACVRERAGAERFTDATPGASAWIGYTNRMSCPSATIEPMTTDSDVLKAKIDTFTARGGTAGHLGAAWAWYLVSPEWASVWPSDSRPVAYSDDKTVKAIILMTDGEFNTAYVAGNGNSPTQAQNLCSEMKGKNVVVYSIAFQSPADAEALLRQCATSADHYFSASDGETLRTAFQSIATNLNKLRLTQ